MPTVFRTLLLLAALGATSLLDAARERPGGDDPVIANVEAVMLQGDLERAKTILDVAIRKNARALYYAIRGGILGEFGELPAAIEDLNKAIKLDPKLAVAWRDRGMARMLLGELDRALPDFDAAVKADPEEPKAWAGRAALQVRREAWDAAIADATTALRLEPRMVATLHDRATALAEEGRLQEAIADYDTMLTLEPGLPLALTARAQIHRRNGDLDRALADADAAVSFDANFADAYTERATIRGAVGDLPHAIADCSTALLIEPGHRSAFIVRALLHIQGADFRAALSDLEAAIAQPGADPATTRRQLAWLLATAPDDAVRDAPRALQLAHEALETYRDQSPQAFDTLAAAAAENGDFPTAIANAERSLAATDARTPVDLAVRRERLELYRNHTPYRLPVGDIAPPHRRDPSTISITAAQRLTDAGEYVRARDLLEEGLHYGMTLPPETLATLGFLLATCPDDRVRDGRLALERAKAALAQGGERPQTFDALAAAYAELSLFPESIAAATHALEINDGDFAEDGGVRLDRLESYRNSTPWRIQPTARNAANP